MALQEKQKDKMRRWIRVAMVFIAILLVVFAVVVPIVNNGIALGVEKELKALPLPANTQLIESTSKAGKIVGNGNGMQYFGAILIKSDLSMEELQTYYDAHGCTVEPQLTADIRVTGNSLSFRHEDYAVGYYTVYCWGSAPDWIRDFLDTDTRGH